MAEPMYWQVAEDLHQQTETGELASGQQLPTEQEPGEHYAASWNTIRDAINRLAAQRLEEGEHCITLQVRDFGRKSNSGHARDFIDRHTLYPFSARLDSTLLHTPSEAGS